VRGFSPDPAVAASAAVALLARLVAFNTVSDRPNRAFIDSVAAYVRECGISPHVITGDGGKAGLIASVGPSVKGGIVLSGHTDVVPVTGQAWSGDPFLLREKQGRLYGRGTADMKGFLAAVLASLPQFAALPLRRPIHLVFSWDEEVGCLAAPRLIEALLAQVARPAAVIVGEPTGMQVADRHRGIATFETIVQGSGGHSSVPQRGANAIAAAARIVGALERMVIAPLAAAKADADGIPEHTTVNVGTIAGGAAVNMIAEQCRFTWECRPGPDATAEEIAQALERLVATDILPDMRARAPESIVTLRRMVSVPPLRASAGSAAVALALQLSGQNATVPSPFASEAGLFQASGIPAVVLGPGWPSQAHQPDEHIDYEQIVACVSFLAKLGSWATWEP
jgi:acetylornithine deacetylase